ncbi:hypothetical protein MANES_18G101800v8 [Manihot esculenta]|uniref:Uncharacterized protein n=1 Tax=Manihot esculenta TaxID=3983 RepID=A0ACB7G0F9_MANES|nr:hypothetical protein MANES_18G101800v8 [Manihot esculenta]
MELLKEKMKDVLVQPAKELIQKIEFINLLCRFGVSYHFDNEIEEQLNHIFILLPKLLDNNNHDFYSITLLFRVMRQYGYKISPDVFNKFKDKDGGFKKTITSDVKGLLSLYEATFLSIHGEDILDEALAFTRQQLEILIPQLSPRVANHVRKALRQPNHHDIDRRQAREYICFYEGEESRDESLLKFAKLDFIRLQLLYKQELASLSRWWKDLNLVEKLPYIRDRIAESYMWAVGIHFEPQYALSRLMLAKYIQLLTLIDDTYDAYGTIDELQTFTAAIERWNIGEINKLPDYMKVLYIFILKFFDEIENNGEIENFGYRTSYAKEKLKEIVKGYFVEAQWFNDGYIPPFDEFMHNGLYTSGHGAIPAISFIRLENIVGNKEYEWVESNPKIIKSVKLLSRLINDITKRKVYF